MTERKTFLRGILGTAGLGGCPRRRLGSAVPEYYTILPQLKDLAERMAEDQLVQQFHKKQRKKKKKKKRQDDDDDDDDEDEDKMYYPSQDYGDDSNVDPEYRPSKKELKGADKEGGK